MLQICVSSHIGCTHVGSGIRFAYATLRSFCTSAILVLLPISDRLSRCPVRTTVMERLYDFNAVIRAPSTPSICSFCTTVSSFWTCLKLRCLQVPGMRKVVRKYLMTKVHALSRKHHTCDNYGTINALNNLAACLLSRGSVCVRGLVWQGGNRAGSPGLWRAAWWRRCKHLSPIRLVAVHNF